MEKKQDVVAFPRFEDLQCPNCGSNEVHSHLEEHLFEYGLTGESVVLATTVPARRCSDCGFEYLDEEAENARHRAVCRHFGLMTPDEIVGLRKAYGLSRSEFSTLTKIGEASLGRWERGSVLQNAANDQYLYLVKFPENLARLRQRNEFLDGRDKAEQLTSFDCVADKFRSLDEAAIEAAKKRAEAFELAPAVGL